MTSIPPPRDLDAPVPVLVAELATRLGIPDTVGLCLELLAGAERGDHLPELTYLTGLPLEPGSTALDPARWKDYWVRAQADVRRAAARALGQMSLRLDLEVAW